MKLGGVDVEKIYKIEMHNGYFLFKLEKVLEEKNISKNKIMRDTNTDFKVIQRICRGNLNKLDIDIIDRICDYLDCEFEDIVEYKRKEKES